VKFDALNVGHAIDIIRIEIDVRLAPCHVAHSVRLWLSLNFAAAPLVKLE
jgi:hypothetical protein